MSTLRTTAYAAAILVATLSLASCDRKAGDATTATPGGTTSGDTSTSATPPASPASPVSK